MNLPERVIVKQVEQFVVPELPTSKTIAVIQREEGANSLTRPLAAERSDSRSLITEYAGACGMAP